MKNGFHTFLSMLRHGAQKIWNAKRIISLGVVFLLLAQMMAVVGYSRAASKSAPPPSDYGVYAEMEELLKEMHTREGEMDEFTQERLDAIEDEIAYFELEEEDIPESPTFSEEEVPATIQDVDVVAAGPKGTTVPDIFELLKEKVVGGDTIFENLIANLTRYYIYTEFFHDNNTNGDHFDQEPATKWTSGDLIPSFANPSQGFKPDLWNGVNLDYNEATGDGDKGFFDNMLGSYEEGSDAWIQLRPIIPLLEEILSDPDPFAVFDKLVGIIVDGGELNLSAGFKIQIQKDSEWVDNLREMPLHVAVAKGVSYEDTEFDHHEYVWTADFNFSETPQNFEFIIMVEGLSLDISDAMSLILELLGMGDPGESYTFTSIFPPYTLRYEFINNTNLPNDEENSIDNLSLLVGYEKFVTEAGTAIRKIEDRTWVQVNVDKKVPDYDYVPRILHIRLFGEKNIIKQLTEYNSVTYYANIPTDLYAVYSEEKENETFILVEAEGFPGGDLDEMFSEFYTTNPFDPDLPMDERLRMRSIDFSFDNLSYRGEGGDLVNKTLINLNSTGEIGSIDIEGYHHLGSYQEDGRYDYYNISTEEVPTDVTLDGGFVFEEVKDPFTLFDNPNMDFMTQVVDNIMLTLASSIYGVGIKLRSLPDALSNMATTGGNISLKIEQKVLDQDQKLLRRTPDLLGDTFLAYAPGYRDYHGASIDETFFAHYLLPARDNYFIGVYENLLFTDPYNRTGLSGALGGIESLYYKSVPDPDDRDNLSRIFVTLNSTIDKPLEVIYLEGIGGNYQNHDFARLMLSNEPEDPVQLPDRITLEMMDNVTTIDFRHPDDAPPPDPNNVTIDSVLYESSLGGQYLSANITHVPHYLQFEISDDVTLINTITEETETGIENEKEAFDLSLAASNITVSRGGKDSYLIRTLDGSHVAIFREGEEKDWFSSVSAKLDGIKKVKYWSTDDGMAHTELRLNGKNELSILLNDTIDYKDMSKGLNGYLYLDPLPSYFRIDVEEVETEKEVEDVEGEDFDDLADIAVVLDSFESFTKSLLDVVNEAADRTTAGVGFSEETDWKFALSTLDPLTDEDTNILIAGEVSRGDVAEMYNQRDDYAENPTRWVNGVSMRQLILDKKEERAIYDAKIYLAAPSALSFEVHQHGDNLNVSTTLRKFGTPGYDNLLVDVCGIDTTSAILYLDGTKMKRDIIATMDFDINSTAENSTFSGQLFLDVQDPDTGTSIQMGRTYMKLFTESEEDPSTLTMFLPQLPTPLTLDISITDSLEMDYRNSEPIDYMLLTFQLGDVSRLAELSEWTHGVSLRETEYEGHRIMDGKLFMTGVPKETTIRIVTEDENTDLEIALVDWDPSIDWLAIDIRGLEKKDFIIYVNGIPTHEPFNIGVTGDVFSNASRNRMESVISFQSDFSLGSMYIKFRNPELDEPVIMETFVPEIPKKLKLHVALKGEILIKLDSSQDIEMIYVKIAKYVEDDWYDLVAIAHDIPTYLKAEIKPNKKFNMDKTIILQGNPDIMLDSSSDDADVFLSLDGKMNWGYGHTTLNIQDASNRTRITLSDDFVYQIRSPGVKSALIILSDLPVMKDAYVEEIYIYAEDIKSVDIEARMLYGLYPIFKLSNADGGKVEVQMDMTASVGNREIEVSAAVVDVQSNSLGPLPLPSIAPLYLNTIATSLSTDHFIIPEPVTTVVATVLKLFGGLFG